MQSINAKFANTDIPPPRVIKENPRTDKSKYYKFHMSVRHETEDFVQLKDVIDDLIKQGKLNRYTNEEGGRSYENMKYDSSRRTPRRSESPRKKRSRKKKEN
jgi:hypothetical protein